jgi:hypothetical protein
LTHAIDIDRERDSAVHHHAQTNFLRPRRAGTLRLSRF